MMVLLALDLCKNRGGFLIAAVANRRQFQETALQRNHLMAPQNVMPVTVPCDIYHCILFHPFSFYTSLFQFRIGKGAESLLCTLQGVNVLYMDTGIPCGCHHWTL